MRLNTYIVIFDSESADLCKDAERYLKTMDHIRLSSTAYIVKSEKISHMELRNTIEHYMGENDHFKFVVFNFNLAPKWASWNVDEDVSKFLHSLKYYDDNTYEKG